MVTLSLRGAHTGDILMALPAIGGLLSKGDGVVVVCNPKYSQAIKPIRAGISWSDDPVCSAITPDFKGSHRSDAWLRHFDVKPERVRLWADGAISESFMPGSGWCVLSPWADHLEKRWTIPQWTGVAQRASRMGYKVAVVGPSIAQAIGHAICRDALGINLVGKCTPQTWPSLLERAKVVISPDTGCVHMADALSVPVIGLYGSTKLDEVGPYWDRSLCIEKSSMGAITADDVGAKLETMA